MSLADRGTNHLRGTGTQNYAHAPPPRASFGGPMPTYTYDLMRRIDADASDLDTAIRSYVADDTFKTAWRRWLVEWQTFFKTKSMFLMKLGSIFDTDGLLSATNGYAADLQGWHLKYAAQKTMTGEAVPPSASSGVEPQTPPKDAPPQSLWQWIPWWAYALGLGMAGALGYSFYKAGQAAKAQHEFLLKNVVPNMLPHFPSGGNPTAGDVDPPL